MEEKILNFLKKRTPKLCTIATVKSDSSPENAVVGFAVLDDLKILINTNFHTRKWSNLKNNKKVALVFGWGFDELNVQYEGTAELIDIDHPDFQKVEEQFFTQNEEARKFKSDDTRLIRISPNWLRLMDPTISPPSIEEKTFQ